MLKTYQKIIGFALSLVFIAITFFGLNMGMDMRHDGTMSGCMFDQSLTCPMNYQEHVNHWQQIFAAIQPAQSATPALLVGIALGGAAFLFSSFFRRTTYQDERNYIPPDIWKQRTILAKLSDHILQALSNGILQPKRYHLAYVIN